MVEPDLTELIYDHNRIAEVGMAQQAGYQCVLSLPRNPVTIVTGVMSQPLELSEFWAGDKPPSTSLPLVTYHRDR
jgi:hypothetical protein